MEILAAGRSRRETGGLFVIIWINGAFGAGKTTVAGELCRRLPGAFCYDPENAGYFLRRNTPPCCRTPDFQDMPLWRQINRQILSAICRQYSGPLVVPMTVINPQYWEEIAGELVREGFETEHFILEADRQTVIRRLKKRNLEMLWREQFALEALDRCLAAFAQMPEAHKIQTVEKDPSRIAEEIAACCGLELPPDRRGKWRQKLDRLKTAISHIRIG